MMLWEHTWRYAQLTTSNHIFTESSQSYPATHQRCTQGVNKIMMGMVVKAKVGELEEEVSEGFSRQSMKECTGGVQGVSGKKSFLVRFQSWFKKDLASNQLTVLIVDKSPLEEEPEVPTIPVIPDEKVFHTLEGRGWKSQVRVSYTIFRIIITAA